MQRLVVAGISSMLAIAPLTAHAAATPTLDSLWNEPQGLSMDSALHVFQAWFDGYTTQVSSDPTQRGFDELSRANTDLLNAYTLLEHAHASGAQPVAIIDPLLASSYNAVTGSNVSAPVGNLLVSINHGLLTLEGRGSIDDEVARLLEESRAMQAAALRDLQARGYDSLIASNAQRDADFLAQVQRVSTPGDGVASLLASATLQATTVAHHQSLTALATHAGGHGKGAGNTTAVATAARNSGGHGKGDGDGKGPGKGGENGSAPGSAKNK